MDLKSYTAANPCGCGPKQGLATESISREPINNSLFQGLYVCRYCHFEHLQQYLGARVELHVIGIRNDNSPRCVGAGRVTQAEAFESKDTPRHSHTHRFAS